MATKPAKNTVEYFPFICAEGKKMYYLEETYGNDGFATFVKILRELANTSFHFLDLSKSSSLMFLSAKCKVPKEMLESIINDLVELGKFDQQLWCEYRVIWCQDFIDSIQDAYKRRTNQCADINLVYSIILKTSGKHHANIISDNVDIISKNVDIIPQTKLNYTKLKESKEKGAREGSNFYQFLMDKNPVAMEAFLMQNKSQIPDWESMIENFNNKMEIEINQDKIEYEFDQLYPRFQMYVRSWIKNQQKDFKKLPEPSGYEAGKLKRF